MTASLLISSGSLEAALESFLPRQRWFAAPAGRLTAVICDKVEVLDESLPALLRVEARAMFEDAAPVTYQVLVGMRAPGDPAAFPEDRRTGIGVVDTAAGPRRAYDAIADPGLCLKLFDLLAPGEDKPARYVRPAGVEQSNSSLIFDDRLMLKIFRRLSEGPNLEAEMIYGLHSAGFTHVPEVVARWRSGTRDLGILQRYLAGGVEGWALAVGSLRDYYERGGDPSEAGGDFAAEAGRLGQATADLHASLAKAFGSNFGDPAAWSRRMVAQLERVQHPRIDREAARRVFSGLADIDDPGPQIRVHGDFHLGQVMRTDAGWFLFDFEGEPARPESERRMPSSPLKDVAGMLRSFHYAAWSTMLESDDNPIDLARGWVQRNRQAFLEGYVAVAHLHGGILPADLTSMEILLRAFEVDKAVYEVGYEMSHRPEWIQVPLASLGQLC